ncbi:MAG: hypothetical protein ACHQAY_18790 [Hyphomicrobiales bacterium]
MNIHPIAAATLAALALSLGAGAATAGQACFRKVASPPLYETVSEPVLVQPARVVARPVPGEYQRVSERVLVRPARVIAHPIPAITQTVAEQVLVQPGGRVWQVRRDAYGQEIGCWVHTPPVYATQYHMVVVQPASAQYETIPAEYEDVSRTVMVRPPSVEHEVIPAVYGSQSRQVMVQPGTVGWQPIGGCVE